MGDLKNIITTATNSKNNNKNRYVRASISDPFMVEYTKILVRINDT